VTPQRNERGGAVEHGRGKCPLCGGRAEASASCSHFGLWTVVLECQDCDLLARACKVRASSGKEATREVVAAWRAMSDPLREILQGGDSDGED